MFKIKTDIRKIIHVDMDAFYASIEQRDNPELRGKPVIVGGPPDSRGVVATCSYEARKYGVHSAMASSKAYRLCPHAFFIRPRFEIYKQVSQQIRDVFFQYTDLVEPLSLDEAYLDVTKNKKGILLATDIAIEILKKIREKTGLTASAGVSFNKFLAKVASEVHKPNGITVITPKKADEFIEGLAIGKFFGVGKVTKQKMLGLGIQTGGDLKKLTEEELVTQFGKVGHFYYNIVRCNDNREVNPNRIRKSISQERTLAQDINDTDEMVAILEKLAIQLEEYMKKRLIKGRTITIKVKYFDFKGITRSRTLETPINDTAQMMTIATGLLAKTDAGKLKVRLLGISLSNLEFFNS